MKKIRVLNIITRLNVGGASIHAVNITYGLAEHCDSILVSGQLEPYETDMAYYAEKYNVPITYINDLRRELSLLSDIKAFFQLLALVRREKPDIVNTHLSKAGTLGRLVAFLCRVPRIYHTFHGDYYKGRFLKLKIHFFIFIEKMLARITTKIIAPTENDKQELIERGIAKADKIIVIKLGFDFSNFVATPNEKYLFREQYQIPHTSLVIALIGRISYQKNPVLFVEIASHFKDKYIYFTLIGDGDLRDEIQTEINNREIQNTVFITGFVRDLKAVYASVDIVLVTSFFEGTCMVLVEAMANSKIAISTDVGGISDYVINGVNGFIVSEPTAECFVDIINQVIEHKVDIESISENAKKTAYEMFSIDRLILEMKDLYTL